MSTFMFGPWAIRPSEIFFTSKYSLGLVNLKPITNTIASRKPKYKQWINFQPDVDLLVMPRRVVVRFADLTSDEVADLFQSVQTIGRVLEREYRGESLTIAVQDGPSAGQTVAHVHVHVIARRKGDYADNDRIYADMDKSEKDAAKELAKESKPQGVDFEDRKSRTQEEMAQESAKLRPFFTQYEDIWP
ncbi:hypothetical protein SmJEL517_g04288 [Synchytrium microbalum]|uniref:Bis(5'-adenosyl)-triphosphatase n=1 Tax=Synchytrium microbalum TaxID=1806994 RepID=A0A507BZV3_9FUNG|nr:uncharacterized protein SmJEL517_g04288 [Synchytrium microbalum]TPX32648.1 hypothetical protein SmJEL517_g04288 [Synchytrium microbalum]